ncbi:protein translocase subunit SecD [Candidatus Gracilibacteria bacterium]|nr:protein translocase subunit SecD [Candidatus Gracilibacteria bacterium]NJM86934.1 protein translocase subunit SecD [Hydrococcus sp. RU_2_2]NJP19031.1 protein translocase subunit SecD [Hydrococcus sp. CRU_1_1]
MQKQRWAIGLILALVVGAVATIITLPPQLGLDLRGGAQLTIQVQPTKEIKEIKPEDLTAVKTVIENRINALGVSEPTIQTVGNDKILVQLPGVTDSQQAERILGGTAQLEFRAQKAGTEAPFNAEYAIKRQLSLELSQLRKNPAQNAQQIAEFNQTIKQSNDAIAKLFESVGLTGKNLKNANPKPTEGPNWEVTISFDGPGGEKFAELTKNLAGTGRSIGIFLDNDLISAPVVDVRFAATGITGGNAVIEGNFTVETANELAVQLRGGSLPFPVAVVENRTVGASLGQDSIRSSIYAGIAGLILVLIFMGVYYRLPGLIADVSLIIYALLSLASFALVGVTLTLPGIAGFILSIGMAVDANVLIFERTREELRAGNTLYRSVEAGFYRAFSSILDSNVTTLIACAALFWLGSGLVKGFALTLAIGVLISMFTALTCSRNLLLLVVLGMPGIRQKPELFLPPLKGEPANITEAKDAS